MIICRDGEAVRTAGVKETSRVCSYKHIKFKKAAAGSTRSMASQEASSPACVSKCCRAAVIASRLASLHLLLFLYFCTCKCKCIHICPHPSRITPTLCLQGGAAAMRHPVDTKWTLGEGGRGATSKFRRESWAGQCTWVLLHTGVILNIIIS